MSGTGGGTKQDIAELVRSHGADALRRELEQMGLGLDNRRRLKCPFSCVHKGPNRDKDAEFFPSGHPRVHCFACNERGDLLDILQLRGLSREDALAQLRGTEAPRPAPALRVVPAPVPVDDPDKLKPAQVKQLWDAMALEDAQGIDYLQRRGLGEAVELGLVRFATEQHPDKGVKYHARSGYRVAALLSDVSGNPRGVQIRAVREVSSKDPKIKSVKGSVTGRAFFGHPGLIESEPVVAVAEGLADTLALAGWVGERPGVAVVGAAGKNALPRLADELELHAVPLEGKYFVLFPQNDAPTNLSRREFTTLAQRLRRLGARVAIANTNKEFKDLAEWLQAKPDQDWPPEELRKVILPEPGDDTPRDSLPVIPDGCAVPVPRQVKAELYRQDFTTLCALLDDAASRESIMGPGELTWCEMTWFARVGGRRIEEVDLSSIRLGLEAHGRSTDAKPLKFSKAEIAEALTVLARRQLVHPVRDWLRSLKWDGHQRIETELPLLFGHEAGSFEAMLLKRWMVSAVARAMKPGTKVDTVLVLIGEQGARKSSFFDCMGGEWFTDAPVQVGDTTGMMIMREKWIVEWAELEAMRRARDQESIKAFLSQRVDFFRAPYLAKPSEAPRHCVIVGTSNNEEFLHDPTGSRRFWPIRVLQRIDIDWVKQAREQLWAEAVALWAAGEQLFLTEAEDAQLAERNQEHQSQDIWFDPIADYLQQNGLMTEITSAQVLHEALGKDVDEWSEGDARRVARILQQLGWKLGRRLQYGGRCRRAYVRPA